MILLNLSGRRRRGEGSSSVLCCGSDLAGYLMSGFRRRP